MRDITFYVEKIAAHYEIEPKEVWTALETLAHEPPDHLTLGARVSSDTITTVHGTMIY